VLFEEFRHSDRSLWSDGLSASKTVLRRRIFFFVEYESNVALILASTLRFSPIEGPVPTRGASISSRLLAVS